MEESGDSNVTTTKKCEPSSGGEPIQIVKIDDDRENHSFYLDEEALTKIMSDVCCLIAKWKLKGKAQV